MRGLRIIPEETRIDFMGWRRLAVGFSALTLVVSILATGIFGLNLGIDFRGGTMIMAETPEETPVAVYRDALGRLGVGDVTVTRISDPTDTLVGAERTTVMIRIESEGEDPGASSETIAMAQEAIEAAAPGVSFLSVESVGAKVSGELLWAGVIAMVVANLAIMVYLWLRFEWQYAVGAIVATVHDVILTFGIFAVLRLEFNLTIVAAILTIIGYSLNDTVVVYDRIRENLRRFKTTPLDEVLNLSINETLSRTVMTTGTTLVAVISLYLLGGEVLRGFAFALIWGVVVGTFSSVYVASPILAWLGVPRDTKEADAAAGVRFGSADAP